MQKINFGIIGVGGIARSQHLSNFKKLDNPVLKTICDTDPAKLAAAGDEFAIPHRTCDYRQLLADPQIDAVLIATNPDSHMPLTLAALDAGKHVYVEKPLAENKEQCQQVIERQDKVKKLVCVGMNRRLAPSYEYANEVLWSDGGPKNMYYRISDNFSLPWGNRQGKEPGSRVFHELCHIFDILRFFAKSEVVSVYCVSSRPDDEIYTLKFDSGSIATVMASGYVPLDMPKERFEAISGSGGVFVDCFAEARTFGIDNYAPVKHFKGHYHVHRDMTYHYLLEQLGMDAVYALAYTKEKLRKEKLSDSTIEQKIYAAKDPKGYFINKGWLETLVNFTDVIQGRAAAKFATAFDGLQAAGICAAAVESRETHKVIKL